MASVRGCFRLCWNVLAVVGLAVAGLIVVGASLPLWQSLALMRTDSLVRDAVALAFSSSPENWGVDLAGFARVPETLYGKAVTIQDAQSRRVLCAVPAPDALPLTEPTMVRWLDWPTVSEPPGGPECAWELIAPVTKEAAAKWAGESQDVRQTHDGEPTPVRVFMRNVGTERFLAPSTLAMEGSPFESIHQAIGGLYHPHGTNGVRFYPANAVTKRVLHLLWHDAMLLAPATTALYARAAHDKAGDDGNSWTPAGTYPLSARQGQGVNIATVIVSEAPRSMDYLSGAGVSDATRERLDIAVVRNATIAPGSLVYVGADDERGLKGRVVSSPQGDALRNDVRMTYAVNGGRFCSLEAGVVEAVIEVETATPFSGIVVTCVAPDLIPELLAVSVSDDNRTWHLVDIMRFRLNRPVTHPNAATVFRMAAGVVARRYVRVGFYGSGLRVFCVNHFALVHDVRPGSVDMVSSTGAHHASVLGRVEAVLADLPAVGSLSAIMRVARAGYDDPVVAPEAARGTADNVVAPEEL